MYKDQMHCQLVVGVFERKFADVDEFATLEPLCMIPPGRRPAAATDSGAGAGSRTLATAADSGAGVGSKTPAAAADSGAGAGSRTPAARVRVPPPSSRREDERVRDRVSVRRRD